MRARGRAGLSRDLATSSLRVERPSSSKQEITLIARRAKAELMKNSRDRFMLIIRTKAKRIESSVKFITYLFWINEESLGPNLFPMYIASTNVNSDARAACAR